MGRKLLFPRGKRYGTAPLSLLNLPACHWRDKVGSAPSRRHSRRSTLNGFEDGSEEQRMRLVAHRGSHRFRSL